MFNKEVYFLTEEFLYHINIHVNKYLYNLHHMYKWDFYFLNTHKHFSSWEFAVTVCNAVFVFMFSGCKHCCVCMHGLTE